MAKHHVRPGLGPERARRGHGKEDCVAGDQTGDIAQQLTGASRPHQSGDQPATPGLPGGATPAVRQTQPRAFAVRLPAPIVFHRAAHFFREQLELPA